MGISSVRSEAFTEPDETEREREEQGRQPEIGDIHVWVHSGYARL
jgi:hypothetical protein